ncbi:2,3-diaminopropionate biosynthesis protein SbnB [Vitiosangium sp. GDMCC 1.1324]|uniref:2,3-diaminopropionate biosynthesis protein SbnB n=1 Tax=Vitiosangium sp. (strain GDMCC 1.1324) TaxID=2138576 RepID=UPI000D3BC612|nr:2,3-diaminopropionate biosynthesis protein SbnB [Vitiosangium sp. GDMCC 1.1324]PTL79250.1 2,3-diaminopropionate biosynthesis protein SbnB [Vitiosangium sp. GDMCC 1.1324]
MRFDFSIITGKVTHDIIHGDVAGCIQQVESAYLTHGEGNSVNPDSYFLRFPEKPDARIIALPAYLGGDVDVSGIKWIASYPANVKRGFPRASAVLLLNSYETGYPFACLESSIISAARTAGSAVLAAQWMNGGARRARCLGIVGNGLISRYLYTFLLAAGWEVDEVLLFDTTPGESERFSQQVCRPERHQRVSVAPDLDSLLKRSDVIMLATTAATPYIHDPALLAHNPLVLNISLRDLAPELLLKSYNLVDDVEHVMKANTSPHLAEKLTGGRAFVTGTLAQLIRGQCKVDRSRPIIFSPFGLGVLDLAVGKWVYDRAVASGKAIAVDDFFFELAR